MSYQVLARKWRPQSFADLIGQEPIVTALRNALAEGRIAQAYLFSGIRGIGKTTAARLLAKALNCERGPLPEPCNDCSVCREITRGGDLDVLEVDAATYSKVEQVRELAESLRYGPARDRYKVVVIDEIHRLSRQAFDALLKIVEEPPAHLVFIFATTEIEAVPVTLLSRCQEFHFRRVASGVVAAHLRRLAEAEGITASDASLRLLARAGEGSVRDAVALLDQLATFGGGEISDGDAVRLLGGLDLELFRELLAALLEGRPGGVRAVVARVEEEGWDPRQVFAQFLAYCRDALHLAMGADADRVDLPREEAEALASLAAAAGYENLLRLSQQLLTSEAVVTRSESGALALEIAWLRAAELPKLIRVEELLAGGAPPAAGDRGAATAGAGGRKRAPSRGSPPAAAPEATAPPPPPDVPPPPEPETPPAGPAATGTVGAFLELVGRRWPPLAARLEQHPPALEDGRLRFRMPREEIEKLQRPAARKKIETALRETFGDEVSYDLLTVAQEAPAVPKEGARKKGGAESVSQDDTVQTVLDLFGGRVEGVEPHGNRGED